MDTASIINRQFNIHYARNREIELAGGTSAKKPKISTREWVLSTFYPGAKAGRSSASLHPVTDGGTVVAANDKIAETRPLPKDDSNRSHEPAVSFRQVVIDSAAEKFKFSLVGKFYRSRPCLELIRKWVLAKLRLVGEWSVTLLDRNHVLIKLDNEDDMLRIWPRSRWFVRGHIMKVFKWTPDFRPSDGEPCTAPVWISFPSLPVVYFEQDLLYAIASLLGRVLSMDVATRRLSRTNVARVCVEVDLLKEHPNQVWIGVEKGGFWQAVKYERLPSYCTECRQQGHSIGICKRKRNTAASQILEMEETKSMNQQASFSVMKPHPGIKDEKHGVHHLNVEKHYQTCPSLLEKDRRGNLVIHSSSHRTLNSLSCRQQVKEGNSEGKEGCKEEVSGCSHPVQEQQRFSARGFRKKHCSDILTIDSFSREKISRIEEKLWRSVEMVHKGKSLIQEKIKEEEEFDDDDDEEEEEEGEDQEVQEADKLVNSKEEKGGKQEIVPSNLGGGYHEEQIQRVRSAINYSLPKQSPHGNGKKKTLFFWKKKSKEPHYADHLVKHPLIYVKQYTLRELQVATDNFDGRNVLGRGGFGKVYLGRLADGYLVAVKRLREERTAGGELQFQTEVEIRGMAVHKNLIPLLGFCMTSTERMLVYPYMANRDVGSKLRDPELSVRPLDWTTRKRIAVGTAEGLSYLHEQINPKIIHRDVKVANILLNEEFEPLICDFGLAKAMNYNDFSVTTAVRGTIGHIAPEYLSTGKVSQKTDVFGYGIMLLELVSGQRAFDLARLANDDDVMLLDWVKELFRKNCLDELVDPNLHGGYNVAELSQLINISLLCNNGSPEERPTMSEVVRMLEEKVVAGKESQPLNNHNLEQAVDACTSHADELNHQKGQVLVEDKIDNGEESVKIGIEMVREKIPEWVAHFKNVSLHDGSSGLDVGKIKADNFSRAQSLEVQDMTSVQLEVEVAQNQMTVSPSSCFNAINSRKSLNPFEDCMSEGEGTNMDVFHDDGVLKISGESWGKISGFDNDSENIKPSGHELRSFKTTESTSRGKMKASNKAEEDSEQDQHHRDKSAVGFNDECHALEQNMTDKNEDGQRLDVVYQEDEQVPERNCGSEAHFDASSVHAHDPCNDGPYAYPGWIVF